MKIDALLQGTGNCYTYPTITPKGRLIIEKNGISITNSILVELPPAAVLYNQPECYSCISLEKTITRRDITGVLKTWTATSFYPRPESQRQALVDIECGTLGNATTVLSSHRSRVTQARLPRLQADGILHRGPHLSAPLYVSSACSARRECRQQYYLCECISRFRMITTEQTALGFHQEPIPWVEIAQPTLLPHHNLVCQFRLPSAVTPLQLSQISIAITIKKIPNCSYASRLADFTMGNAGGKIEVQHDSVDFYKFKTPVTGLRGPDLGHLIEHGTECMRVRMEEPFDLYWCPSSISPGSTTTITVELPRATETVVVEEVIEVVETVFVEPFVEPDFVETDYVEMPGPTQVSTMRFEQPLATHILQWDRILPSHTATALPMLKHRPQQYRLIDDFVARATPTMATIMAIAMIMPLLLHVTEPLDEIVRRMERSTVYRDSEDDQATQDTVNQRRRAGLMMLQIAVSCFALLGLQFGPSIKSLTPLKRLGLLELLVLLTAFFVAMTVKLATLSPTMRYMGRWMTATPATDKSPAAGVATPKHRCSDAPPPKHHGQVGGECDTPVQEASPQRTTELPSALNGGSDGDSLETVSMSSEKSEDSQLDGWSDDDFGIPFHGQ